MSWLSEMGTWFAGLLAAIGIGTADPPNTYHGYVEGEYVRLAAPLAGRLERLHVARGDTVRAGQVVARVGNNGYGRNPHIHIGAWKGETPYQIRWDLRSNAQRTEWLLIHKSWENEYK